MPTRLVPVLAACVLAAGCASGAGSTADPTPAETSPAAEVSASPAPQPVEVAPGIVSVGLADAYTPTPQGKSTDDYRCFLIATGISEDRFITGVRFLPDNPEVVHHAILYRVQPAQLAAAKARDEKDPGQGWSCFGGPDLPSVANDDAVRSLDSAPWLAAWAPGGRESRYPDGTGVYLPAGSSVILQVHYNTLAGVGPDMTSVQLRTSPGTDDLRKLETVLLPAPVELPCAPDETGPLCDREAAVADTIERFGGEALRTIWGLQFICGGDLVEPKASATQSCTHDVNDDMTVYSAAGHMHLLGRSITIVANVGTPREKVLLDVETYDFDRQGGIPLKEPYELKAGDTVTVTCTHDTGLRKLLPALQETEPRYIVWGDGTTDEMCLGIMTAAAKTGA
ncbi:MAG: monooxygenase [Actinomycetota bacterium]